MRVRARGRVGLGLELGLKYIASVMKASVLEILSVGKPQCWKASVLESLSEESLSVGKPQ